MPTLRDQATAYHTRLTVLAVTWEDSVKTPGISAEVKRAILECARQLRRALESIGKGDTDFGQQVEK